jgi:hypothetical protein
VHAFTERFHLIRRKAHAMLTVTLLLLLLMMMMMMILMSNLKPIEK